MKALDTKVNLIPVIAKSDLITRPEMIELKSKIMSEIESNRINIYHFPTDDESEVSEMNAKTNSNLPFAVVASNEFVLIDGQDVRARQYPWGTVEGMFSRTLIPDFILSSNLVENETHSDLRSLREMILRTNLNDLKETTHCLHYQHYRSQRLEQLWNDKQKQHLTQMKLKERLLIDNFTIRLRAKELELKKTEKELHQKFELLSKERIEEKMRLDLDKQRLEEEIKSLNIRKQLMFGRKNSGHYYSTDRKPPTTPKSKTKSENQKDFR